MVLKFGALALKLSELKIEMKAAVIIALLPDWKESYNKAFDIVGVQSFMVYAI